MSLTVEDLYRKLAIAIEDGKGKMLVGYGDCNAMHKASWAGEVHVEDVDTHYLEAVEMEDYTTEGELVFVVGE